MLFWRGSAATRQHTLPAYRREYQQDSVRRTARYPPGHQGSETSGGVRYDKGPEPWWEKETGPGSPVPCKRTSGDHHGLQTGLRRCGIATGLNRISRFLTLCANVATPEA
ncbi:TPA: hypothetical protein LC301_003913 [Salmonella enterica subsp. enterica serovar Veneziana]|nr:hypothetical protein [Salmonella enterica subsp. enterica serovar Veneziana]